MFAFLNKNSLLIFLCTLGLSVKLYANAFPCNDPLENFVNKDFSLVMPLMCDDEQSRFVSYILEDSKSVSKNTAPFIVPQCDKGTEQTISLFDGKIIQKDQEYDKVFYFTEKIGEQTGWQQQQIFQACDGKALFNVDSRPSSFRVEDHQDVDIIMQISQEQPEKKTIAILLESDHQANSILLRDPQLNKILVAHKSIEESEEGCGQIVWKVEKSTLPPLAITMALSIKENSEFSCPPPKSYLLPTILGFSIGSSLCILGLVIATKKLWNQQNKVEEYHKIVPRDVAV